MVEYIESFILASVSDDTLLIVSGGVNRDFLQVKRTTKCAIHVRMEYAMAVPTAAASVAAGAGFINRAGGRHRSNGYLDFTILKWRGNKWAVVC